MANPSKLMPINTPGIITFMGLPRGDIENLREGMVAIVGVSYDLSCTSKIGSRFAPRAIRDSASYYAGAFSRSDLVEITTGDRMSGSRRSNIIDLGDLNVYPLDWDRTEKSLRSSIHQIAQTRVTPFIIGGDHLISYPLALGFADAVKELTGRNTGYIQISSRLDLGESDPIWGKVWRGSTARQILESGAIKPTNMVWVGTNGYLRKEDLDFAKERALSVFPLEEIRNSGLHYVMEQALDIASDGCDSIYVSIDLDVVDGGYVSASADTRFDGLTNVELLNAIDMLRRSKVGAVDLVGMNPTINMASATGQRFGAWLIIRFLAGGQLAKF